MPPQRNKYLSSAVGALCLAGLLSLSFYENSGGKQAEPKPITVTIKAPARDPIQLEGKVPDSVERTIIVKAAGTN